jgi:Mycobacterial 4 TMS phage holin, superfamily IV
MKFLIKVFITAVNAFVLAYLLPGIEIKDFLTAVYFARNYFYAGFIPVCNQRLYYFN